MDRFISSHVLGAELLGGSFFPFSAVDSLSRWRFFSSRRFVRWNVRRTMARGFFGGWFFNASRGTEGLNHRLTQINADSEEAKKPIFVNLHQYVVQSSRSLIRSFVENPLER